MNVEAQVIKVPTGLQDYRPAMYGGIAAIELGAHGLTRVPLSVDPLELQRRIVLCYTGEPRNSGTNNWEITKRHIDGDAHVFDCFERIRDTAAAMREALQPRRLVRHGAPSGRGMGESQAPGAWRHDTDHRRPDRARAWRPARTAAKVCGAGGGGCLFCLAPPRAHARPCARRWRPAARGCSTSASKPTGLRVE